MSQSPAPPPAPEGSWVLQACPPVEGNHPGPPQPPLLTPLSSLCCHCLVGSPPRRLQANPGRPRPRQPTGASRTLAQLGWGRPAGGSLPLRNAGLELTAAKPVVLQSKVPGFKSQLCHLLASGPQASHFVPLCLCIFASSSMKRKTRIPVPVR